MTESRIGVAQVDITPSWAGPTSGWGIGFSTRKAQAPEHAFERPQVTAVALSGSRGDLVVLANIDIHGGSRPIWEGSAKLAGIDPSQLVLCGSHTHNGPGQPYGNAAFAFASTTPFDLKRMRNHLVKQVGSAVQQAINNLTPGGVDIVRGEIADVGNNRATPAWKHYSEETINRFLTDGPGRSLADRERLSQRYRDPRITVLVAKSDDGEQVGMLGWYGLHPNSLGAKWPTYSADLYGWARDRIGRDMPAAVVGFGGGAGGDISPLEHDDDAHLSAPYSHALEAQGAELAAQLGGRVGDVVVELAGRAKPMQFTVETTFLDWNPTDTLPGPQYGMSQLSGGSDGPTSNWTKLEAGADSERAKQLQHRQLSTEGGQGPKLPWLLALTKFPIPLAWAFRLVMSKPLPLHVVRVGDHVFGTVPGEPTTMSAWRIEQDLLANTGAVTASVIGYAGDYCGYWVTPEEYLQQRYEAASTVYGSQAVPELRKQLIGLAKRMSAPL